MKNIVKEIAEVTADKAFTIFNFYQPKMPKSLMEKTMDENKKEN